MFSDSFAQILDVVVNLNLFIAQMVDKFGWVSYLILFLVVFCETGLVITPFLPGDSLLFAVGAIAATSNLSIYIVIICLILAAFIGDQCNYWIGRKFSQYLIRRKLIKVKHIEKTQGFYKRHGAKTLVIARFLPIVRTFAPFVAGVGKMRYIKYLFVSILSAIIWVVIVTLCGYLFGNIPVIRNNFSIAIFIIILLSVLPGVIIAFWERKKSKN
jgi:membrane-associated protein